MGRMGSIDFQQINTGFTEEEEYGHRHSPGSTGF